ncbi:hypothetical protein LHGZ1_0812 [Laribacter hongkongensis]|uniref:Uncharacterized protein n=1 Tax=Laribacter hongkongensis TaxID=168471 RepID=A0A248LHF1_9NEIS|nr:hypothetical protein LHGZ1_0812 [Laribacter hongkongensis]
MIQSMNFMKFIQNHFFGRSHSRICHPYITRLNRVQQDA